MRVYIPNLNKEGIGGGNSFVRNFCTHTTLELTEMADAEVMFVPNPMWAERSDFEQAKQNGIKTVLRLDNIPEDWNNRGTAISKLKDFIQASDALIYQSLWSAEKYKEFIVANDLAPPTRVYTIHNGVDTDLFTPDGPTVDTFAGKRILFVKSSRNENKRWLEAMELFRRYYAHNKESKLYLVGQFADDFHKYNFGFYNGEQFEYLGMQPHEDMPIVYRSVDVLFFPAFADCAPNTVLEAMSCGVVPIIHPYGGASEFLGYDHADGEYDYGVSCLEQYQSYGDMMEDALGKDRQSIREHVVKNFNIKDCMRHYEKVLCQC